MQKSGLKLFQIHGINIYLHSSWWIIFAFLTYSLAGFFFPELYPGFTRLGYILMGVIAAVLLFVSVLLHELTHSFVAKHFKLEVESVTLFFFGGVASLPTEDIKPKVEFWMALSGPLFSLFFACVLYIIHQFPLPLFFDPIVGYLWQVNLILALFNLVPGFPLDGGRVFRALLMFYYNDIEKATKVASIGGKIFGGFLFILGFLSFFGGALNGLWFMLIGGFIWFVAKNSYQHVVVKKALEHISIMEVVDTSYYSLSPKDKFSRVIELYKKSEFHNFIVERQKKFVGLFDLRRSHNVPLKMWKKVLVGPLMIPASKISVVTKKDSVYAALQKMDKQGVHLLPFVDKNKVKGIVTRRKILHFLALRLEYGISLKSK